MVMTMLVMMRVALYQRLIQFNVDLQHIITLLSKRTSKEMNIIAEYITFYES